MDINQVTGDTGYDPVCDHAVKCRKRTPGSGAAAGITRTVQQGEADLRGTA